MSEEFHVLIRAKRTAPGKVSVNLQSVHCDTMSSGAFGEICGTIAGAVRCGFDSTVALMPTDSERETARQMFERAERAIAGKGPDGGTIRLDEQKAS